jgi:hypothetical protein
MISHRNLLLVTNIWLKFDDSLYLNKRCTEGLSCRGGCTRGEGRWCVGPPSPETTLRRSLQRKTFVERERFGHDTAVGRCTSSRSSPPRCPASTESTTARAAAVTGMVRFTSHRTEQRECVKEACLSCHHRCCWGDGVVLITRQHRTRS